MKATTQTEQTAQAAQTAPNDTLGTRERIVRAASRLMQRQGYEGTGIKQISREAEATLGSVYHFFPGGKQELATEAVRYGDREFADTLRAVLDSEEDPAAAVAATARVVAEELRASDWIDGCPVTATSLGTATTAPDIQQAAAEAFARWRGLMEDRLRRAGIGEEDAHDLAHTVIHTLEGAELAAQVARSDEPLLIAGRHLARLVNSYR
ncbi:TetR/AcrR family transcriptional regulator [Streptomyces sp. UNOC14_S4]|uniref:TetR/AcrR family transcriptional regulator n=1 Tax=Streptomyces sp. UNOC14_S4 TaxID=2872340 RepID=UPI0023AEE68B|nr:TetR/AcrR family transcriptional regulator [Streptomyces sp. UNOC14_S4]MCC3768463.1 TetR/AcrR family transcriptional regulator [Streptomyces sp. UNOC14_S4]